MLRHTDSFYNETIYLMSCICMLNLQIGTEDLEDVIAKFHKVHEVSPHWTTVRITQFVKGVWGYCSQSFCLIRFGFLGTELQTVINPS